MDITLILLIIGLISIILSFFFGNSSGGDGDDIENISISLHQETNQLKKRLRAVEEELMIGVNPIGKILPAKNKPVHEIIINQILSLHAQGYSIAEIAKRSSLSTEQVLEVLQARGVSI
ncbi:helix-turn-helix domain-containing protein [Sporosarcina oncorhynchi]|uniref:Helix-turn-helix domain-containing protein n=1 Tax=Sporosarcina oncorhynchi TaxID=3056444 RepID=A0ABZ0L9U6_9BACL|nr:helix-turn-helix domain-containing protein [Sporosarcina sp. T2O-4]WOV88848.1 helix-turn-helix domain-containing protein [Sporosarcina sp. T2O-4]